MTDEQCRYCTKAQTGNNKYGHLTMYCKLYGRIVEVFPNDRCECFHSSGCDIWNDCFIAVENLPNFDLEKVLRKLTKQADCYAELAAENAGKGFETDAEECIFKRRAFLEAIKIVKAGVKHD